MSDSNVILTDADIIKALECCFVNSCCKGCPLSNPMVKGCLEVAGINAASIIKRQKAEIDRLRQKLDYENYECERCACDLLDQRDRAKPEAIREFAERLKKKRGTRGEIWDNDIDNLVKEMTEDKS